ncbi:unnamed protein product [Brachionus calyciflorus]|uniref:G-protein coupled receptors family 1 profile domain-containing protein n=1 Tax=Brachionus calyciflorus TaxID=104777 RepID=A0A814DB35_9BILA|nr:unnamed protein product [Brachionus calyciflorus]
MSTIYFIHFFNIIYNSFSNSNNVCENYNSKCILDPSQMNLKCLFNSFDNIGFNCSQNKPINTLTLIPRNKLILDRKLNFSNFYSNISKIKIVNLKGFDSEINPLKPLKNLSHITLHIDESDFEFRLNGLKLEPNNTNLKIETLFSMVYKTVYLKDGVVYKSEIFPLVFKNSKISILNIRGITDTFLRKNCLRFWNKTSIKNINSSIDYLKLNIDNSKLNNYLLNSDLFSLTTTLSINGHLKSIEDNVFKNFKNLKFIKITVRSFKQFYHQIGLKWLSSLPNKIPIYFYSKDSSYTYPDEDFCIFSKFSNAFKINPIEQSCTTSWILNNTNSNNIICNFELLLNKCYSLNQIKSLQFDYDSILIEKLISLFIIILIKPILCIICISLNIINIKIIFDNKMNKIKMYKFILIGSIIDILICVFYLLETTSECVQAYGIFCSWIQKSLFSQYLKLIGVNFFGNILKMCSNYFSIAFSIDRYLINSKVKNKFFNYLNRITINKILLIILSVSILLNINKIYDYKIEKFDGVEESESEVNEYQIYPHLNIDLFKENLFFLLTFFFNPGINDLICVFLIILIDILLIKIVRVNLKNKLAFGGITDSNKNRKSAKMTEISKILVRNTLLFSFISMEKIHELNIMKKYKKMKQNLKLKPNYREVKITLMVILNGFFIIVFRLPEFLFSFILIDLKVTFVDSNERNLQSIDSIEFKYNFYQKVSQLCFINSLILKIFIFYLFDKNFKKGFRKIFIRNIGYLK